MLFLLLIACSSGDDDTAWPEGIGPIELVDVDAWSLTATADDPWPDHRPDDFECSPLGWYEESGGIEVDTSKCDYFSASQPLLSPVGKGSPVDLVGWNAPQALLDTEDTGGVEVHMALTISGEVLWEKQTAIPCHADVFSEQFTAPFSAEAGETVVLHVHNHGYNTWNLHSLVRVAP